MRRFDVDSEIIKQTVGYTEILHMILAEIARIRIKIFKSPIEKFNAYKEAVEGLIVMLIPRLKPRELMNEVEDIAGYVYEVDLGQELYERAKEGIKKLDELVNRIIADLEEAKLLYKKGGIFVE